MSVTVTYVSTATAVETLATNVPFAPTPTITHSSLSTSGTLNSSSTPAVSKMATFQQALTSGAATIDLTSLTGTNGASVTFNGLKLALVKFRNPAANANAITITFGASTGYLLHGSGWKIILQPGEEYLWRAGTTANAAPTVSSSLKSIDLAGTGSQALDCELHAG